MGKPKRKALVATVAAHTANSYVTPGFADDYFSGLLEGDDWFAFPGDRREVALMTATRDIDACITESGLDGVKYYGDAYGLTEQSLLFPRTFDLDPVTDDPDIPEDIEKATCELALWRLKRRRGGNLIDTQEMRERGVRAVSVDGISVTLGRSGFNEWPRHIKKWVSQFWNRGGETVLHRDTPMFHDWATDKRVAT